MTYKTVRIIYGNSLKHRIANYLHKRGGFKIVYNVPIIRGDEQIGEVATMTGSNKALWLMGHLFKAEEEIEMFALAKDGHRAFELI